MRRTSFTILFIFWASQFIYCQRFLADPSLEGLYKFSDNYFRSDPFKGEFSNFLQHLLNDPGITGKNSRKRTDSSLYSLTGRYTTYNPFFFKPKRVEIILEETSVQYTSDSTARKDTIFVYQLVAYTEDNPERAGELKKEMERIHRRNKGKFFDNEYKELPEDNPTLRFYNYYLPAYVVAPVSVMQGKEEKENELFLSIILRFKRNGNTVSLPAPFNRF